MNVLKIAAIAAYLAFFFVSQYDEDRTDQEISGLTCLYLCQLTRARSRIDLAKENEVS